MGNFHVAVGYFQVHMGTFHVAMDNFQVPIGNCQFAMGSFKNQCTVYDIGCVIVSVFSYHTVDCGFRVG